MQSDRRRFIKGAVGAASLTLIGCSGDDGTTQPTPDSGSAADGGVSPDQFADDARVDGGAPTCADPFAGGKMLSVVPFTQEGATPLDTVLNSGLDGRLYSDLTAIEPDSLLTPIDKFYIRTREPGALQSDKGGQPWTIALGGLIEQQKSVKLDDLTSLIEPIGKVTLECSGNGRGGSFGLLSATEWEGIPLPKVLEMVKPTPTGKRVLVNGYDKHTEPSANNHSTPGASWIYTPDQLEKAYLATHMGGKPLIKDHGAPVRLLVPRWYGCCNVKWVDRIDYVADDAPATSQMMEFASRTHQSGTPSLARDYIPAEAGHAAMPIRIEKWELDGKISYRVLGILWGGSRVTDKLMIRFNPGEPYRPVDICPAPTTTSVWTLWMHRWTPTQPGNYQIRCKIDDASIDTLRLDIGFYTRFTSIDQV